MPSHTVKQGECLTSIARQHGFRADTIWNHEKNKALRDKRKSPNILYAGDVVHLPDKEQKQLKVTPNATHQFKVQGKPPELRLCLLQGGKPVKDAQYTLSIDGVEREPRKQKKTDGKGMVIATVSAAAQAATVTVGKLGTVFQVKLGHLDPITEPTGVKARLRQLGYFPGPVEDGKADELFHVGVWLFQNNKGLVPTGVVNDATLDELKNAYGV
jgi:hypothetical protein